MESLSLHDAGMTRHTLASRRAGWGGLGFLAGWVFWAIGPLGLLPGALGQEAAAGKPPETSIDRQLEECIARDPTTDGMVQCTVEATQAWEQELQRTYEALMRVLDPPGRQDLQRAQTAWVAFRNAESVWLDRLYAIPSGTMYLVMAADDRMELVKGRVLRLQSYLELAQAGVGPGDRVQRKEKRASDGRATGRSPLLRARDRELAQAYRALLRELDFQKLLERFCAGEPGPLCLTPQDATEARRALRSAQKAWWTYRRAEFAWHRRLYGQEADPAHVSFVEGRIQALKYYRRILMNGLE
ncbi:hypothetical protein HRbin11_02124 [bacterium HR11]|nr:hypothetical protein HRbin11_02124 [bacterium HR11]